ncbi:MULTISPECIES: DUF3634 family protein [Oceanisphaera]|uniref:DUF3634 family protein n=1 Tax=Oceanisphaera ostreae TaxID=914151 RepID=A0ABW3KJV5_9GAMM
MFSNMLLVSLALFALLYLLRRRQERFLITIEGAHVKVTRGQPPQALVLHCRQLIQDAYVLQGTIRGLKKGNEITLSCSRSIPASYRQNLHLFWQQQ